MRKVMGTFVAGFGLWLAAQSALARDYCYEPREPFCIGGMMMRMTENDFRDCRNAVSDYIREMESYARCVRNPEERSRAIRRANRVVERFNCVARGYTGC